MDTRRTSTEPWMTFARRARFAAACCLGLAVAGVVVVRATSDSDVWDKLDPWTYLIPTVCAGAAFLLWCLGAWAVLALPRRRIVRWCATTAVALLVPAADALEFAQGHTGWGVIEVVATVVMAVGSVIVMWAVLGVPAMAALRALERRRTRAGKPTLDEAVVNWLRTKRRRQQVAAALIGVSAVWLLVATFVPPRPPDRGGVFSVFGTTLQRFTIVGSDLAIGLAGGGVVMWFEGDPFWGEGRPRGVPRRHTVHARGRANARTKRWASRP